MSNVPVKRVEVNIGRDYDTDCTGFAGGTLHVTLTSGRKVSVELFERPGASGKIAIRAIGGRLLLRPQVANVIEVGVEPD